MNNIYYSEEHINYKTLIFKTKIIYLGIKNQLLIAKSLDLGCIKEAKELQKIDYSLILLLLNYKMFGGSTYYVWNTAGDDRVRPSHDDNEGKYLLGITVLKLAILEKRRIVDVGLDQLMLINMLTNYL